ncbi:MAG: lipopolysaccharide biosynthesis protein [Gaiellaceae bacterium]
MTARSDAAAPSEAGLTAAAATTGRTVLGGGAWSTAGRIIPQLYTLVLSIAAARFLTTGEFGRQSFIAFVELSLVMLLTAGLPLALMRYIGESLGRGRADVVRGLIRWAWAVEAAAAILGAGVLVAAAALGAEPTGAWALAGVACALGILHTVPSSLLIGAQLWRPATTAGLVNGGIATVATVAVLAAGGGITGMFAVEAVTSAAILVWTTILARRAEVRISPSTASAGELQRQVTRWALVATIGVALNFIVWRRSEFFFLDRFSSDTEIGLYSIAFSLVVAMTRLPEAFADVITPAVATLYGAGAHERITKGYSRAVRLLLILALPFTAAGFALGPAAITAVWGDEYAGATPPLLIMLGTFPLLPLLYVARSALVGIGRQRFLIAVSAVAAAVDISLAVTLVPRYDAVGATLANGSAQLAAAIPLTLYARRTFGQLDWAPAALLRTAVASGAAGLAALAAVLLLGGLAGVLVGLAAGVIVFGALAAAVKILPAEDAAWLDGALGRIAGGRLGRAALLFGQRPR